MRTLLKLTAFAIVAALLTAGTATAAKLITGKDIKNGSITAVDVKNGSLTAADIKKGSLKADRLHSSLRNSLRAAPGAAGKTGAQGPAGAQGAKGDTGAPGQQGPKGDRGPSTIAMATKDSHLINSPQTGLALELMIGAGPNFVQAKFAAISSDPVTLDCDLQTNIGKVLDQTDVELVAGKRSVITLMAPTVNGAEHPLDDEVRIVCNKGAGANVTLYHVALSALQVAEIAPSS